MNNYFKGLSVIKDLLFGRQKRAMNKLAIKYNKQIIDFRNLDQSIQMDKENIQMDKENIQMDKKNRNAKANILNGFYVLKKINFKSENIYTAAFDLKGSVVKNNKYKLETICFSDKNYLIDNLIFNKPLKWDVNLKKLSLFHKYMSPFFDSEINEIKKFIWIDARVEITEKISRELFDLLDKHDLIFFKHPWISNLHDELKEISRNERASDYEVMQANELINKINIKDHFETNIFAFKNTKENLQLFKEIYGFCSVVIQRDQVAVPYLLSLNKVKYHLYKNGDVFSRTAEGVDVKPWQ